MNRKWVTNASPLIFLAKIEMLWLLPKLCIDLAIPSGVIEKINNGPVDDPARKWIASKGARFLIDAGNVPTIISAWIWEKGNHRFWHGLISIRIMSQSWMTELPETVLALWESV